jgi:hypothetical protein
MLLLRVVAGGLLAVAADTVEAACSSALDCELNGKCVQSKCVCFNAWSGDQCGVLRLLPAAMKNGFRHANVSSWGGTVLKSNGTFHMFVGAFRNNCGLTSWFRNEEIFHTVSDTPEGPYTIRASPGAHRKPKLAGGVGAGVISPLVSTCPHSVRSPDGKYLIFHTSCGKPYEKNGTIYPAVGGSGKSAQVLYCSFPLLHCFIASLLLFVHSNNAIITTHPPTCTQERNVILAFLWLLLL